MSHLAIMLEACRMVGIREPSEFYALSETTRGLWTAHAYNTIRGVYYRVEPTKEEAAEARKQAAIAAAIERGALPSKGA